MATPSSRGDADKAIPQSLPPPSLMESRACLQQEDIVDQSLSVSDSAWLQQLLLQQEDVVDQSQLFHDSPLPQELLHGNRYDASEMSGPTSFTGPPYFSCATSFTGATSFSGRTSFTGATSFNCGTSFSGPTSFNCATLSGATRHCESSGTILGYDEVEEVGTQREGRGDEVEEVGTRREGRGDEVEEVGTRSEGRGEGEMAEGHLNSAGCLRKGKRKVRSPSGERGNKKTTGVRIEIPLEDILKVKEMRLQDAARHFEVSVSTLKRVCRGHSIPRWPPHMVKNCINQSGPSESLLAVDQERIAQQRPDTPRSNTPRSSNTEGGVIIKARYVKDSPKKKGYVEDEDRIIKFGLSRPWVMVKLKQQVQKRLELEAGTYDIMYKDEEGDLIIIACDKDLQEYISNSRPRGTTPINSITVFLVPK